MAHKLLLNDLMLAKGGKHPPLYDMMNREQLLCAAFFTTRQRFMQKPSAADPVAFFSAMVVGPDTLGTLTNDALRAYLHQHDQMRAMSKQDSAP